MLKNLCLKAKFSTGVKQLHFGEYLKRRGLIYQSTDSGLFEEDFVPTLSKEKNNFSIYCGFDPTSDSLHLGGVLKIKKRKLSKKIHE
jgi:tyrosyl-tRNA synthetase